MTPGSICGRPRNRPHDATIPPDVHPRCRSSCTALCTAEHLMFLGSQCGLIHVGASGPCTYVYTCYTTEISGFGHCTGSKCSRLVNGFSCNSAPGWFFGIAETSLEPPHAMRVLLIAVRNDTFTVAGCCSVLHLSGCEAYMQFWRSAHLITVGCWSDAIDVGYAELRSEFRTNQSVAREFHSLVGRVQGSDHPSRELR